MQNTTAVMCHIITPFGIGNRYINPDPNPFQTPPEYIYIQAGDSVLFPATTEFLRMMQDLNTGTPSRASARVDSLDQ